VGASTIGARPVHKYHESISLSLSLPPAMAHLDVGFPLTRQKTVALEAEGLRFFPIFQNSIEFQLWVVTSF
jgi:hypothetical protein